MSWIRHRSWYHIELLTLLREFERLRLFPKQLTSQLHLDNIIHEDASTVDASNNLCEHS
jgi:hypothetical protein